MKITIIGSAWPLRGGLAAYNERLATEFRNSGHEVSIETFSLQYPGFLFPGKTQYADWPAPAGLKIRASVNSVNPFNWLRTGLRLRREKPDLVVIKYWLPFMGPSLGTLARLVRSNRHTKVVTIFDNVIPHEKRPGDRLFTRYYIKASDAFVAMSDSVLEDTYQFDRRKPRALCPHPIFDNFGPALPRKEAKELLGLDTGMRYILFFGFIRDYKGLDLLIKAFADPRFRGRDLRLLVAGEFYSDPAPYMEMIREHHLEDEIVIRSDFIPDEEVKKYFSAADVVVQPYKTATQSGISQIAYHFEKPMIVTRVGGLPEIVPDGRVGFVTDTEPGSIAAAILRYFDEGLEQQFAANAALEKEKYSWKRMAETITGLLQQTKDHDHTK